MGLERTINMRLSLVDSVLPWGPWTIPTALKNLLTRRRRHRAGDLTLTRNSSERRYCVVPNMVILHATLGLC